MSAVNLRRFVAAASLAAVCAAAEAGSGGSLASALNRPNFVVVLADDLGYGDLACYGDPVIKTPNLDRLAAEGVRLTNCYAAAANCSPSRTGLMTGRTPYRVGVRNWIDMFSPMHVGRNETTVATLLRRIGYDTCHVGKWHMNGKFNMPDQPQPSDHGFNHWFSTQNNALPSHENPDNFVRNGKPVGRLEGYSSGLVVDEAIRWLREIRDPTKPLFLYVCFHEPHEPIAAEKRFRDLYASAGDPRQAEHHGSITQMDHHFGRLMRTLDEMGLRDQTLVMFTSDNGPAITAQHPYGSAGPLREKKGHLYEGGIRVPGIIRWPGHARPGTVSDEPLCGVDLMPTVCAITDIPIPADRVIDGPSFLPIFEGRPIERRTPLYWQFNYSASDPKVAMRVGDWKILATLDRPGQQRDISILAADQENIKKAELAAFELYNLRRDIGETKELSGQEPERLAAMAAQLRRLYHEVRDEGPLWPEWEWSRYEGQRLKAARAK